MAAREGGRRWAARLGLGVALVAVGWACESSTTPVPSARLEAVSGDGQTGIVGMALPGPVVVRSIGTVGEPQAGVEVRFTVTTGAGTLDRSSAVTDDEGHASVTWTLGTASGGQHRLRAELADDPAVGVVFEASGLAGPPAALEVVDGDEQLGAHSGQLPAPVVVLATDVYGNPVSGADVAFSAPEGYGSLEPPSAATDSEGRASARWTLGPGLGEQVATATVDDIGATITATALEQAWVGGTVTSVVGGGEVQTTSPLLGEPAADASAGPVTVTGTELAMPGGGALFTLEADAPFSVVYVFVGGRAGYYRLELGSAPAPSAEIVLTLGPSLDEESYQFEFAVGTGSGAGPREPHVATIHDVPTGPVQVSVTWDVPSDVDLYLVEPSGETVWYGNPESASGAMLTGDANEACVGEDLRNESITWAEEPPPRGTYVVRLNFWTACEQGPTRWVVTVRRDGEPPVTYRGEFTQETGVGDVNSGEVVTTFVF